MRKIYKYFYLNKSERNGFTILFCLIVLLFCIPFIYSLFLNRNPTAYEIIYFSESGKRKQQQNKFTNIKYQPFSTTNKKDIKYFNFDPNTLSDSEWIEFGLSEKQTSVIRKFLNKGGRFYTKEDVAKMYSISDKKYKELEPYIRIAEKEEWPVVEKKAFLKRDVKIVQVELNTTDTTNWKQLRGIGTVLANRIVKYQEALGGFHNLEQLKEVYGLSEEVFESIKHQIIYNNSVLRKLNINQSTLEVLAKHPYISRKYATIIVNYKKQHGDILSFENLKELKALNQEFLRKIEPYLEF